MSKTGGGPGTNHHQVRGVGKRSSSAPTAPAPAADRVASFPASTYESQVWDWQGERPRGRADREFKHYQSSLPPHIGDVDLHLARPTRAAINDANAAINDLERDPNVRFAGIAGSLLRSESVASSKIERLNVGARDLGVAAIDDARLKSDAAQVWANVTAMQVAIDEAIKSPVSIDTFHLIHRALMRDDPYEADWAGRLRDMQSWVGGSDYCPRDASHVPPAPQHIPGLMDDLAVWCERRDVDPLARAAVAHAQFETIHPYTDGNGRTGRAIIHTVLRRAGTVSASVVPASSALLADINTYFDALTAFRDGDVDFYLQHVAVVTARASVEARSLGGELKAISDEMRASGVFRPGSVAETIASGLLQQPVVSASRNAAADQGGAAGSTIYRAIESLVEGGILEPITDSKRNQMWSAPLVTAALDEFGRRLGQRQSPFDR